MCEDGPATDGSPTYVIIISSSPQHPLSHSILATLSLTPSSTPSLSLHPRHLMPHLLSLMSPPSCPLHHLLSLLYLPPLLPLPPLPHPSLTPCPSSLLPHFLPLTLSLIPPSHPVPHPLPHPLCLTRSASPLASSFPSSLPLPISILYLSWSLLSLPSLPSHELTPA